MTSHSEILRMVRRNKVVRMWAAESLVARVRKRPFILTSVQPAGRPEPTSCQLDWRLRDPHQGRDRGMMLSKAWCWLWVQIEKVRQFPTAVIAAEALVWHYG